MSEKLRMTYPTAMVLQALERGHRYGFEIAEAAGLRPGSVYQILRRLEDAEMVRGQWEDAEIAHEEGRPARRYYGLTRESEPELVRARARFPALEHVPAAAQRGGS